MIMSVIVSQKDDFVLPYFLSLFQRLTYPKNKIHLYIRSGNSSDKTKEMFKAWLRANIHMYHSVDSNFDDEILSFPEIAEDALEEARNLKLDYIWFLNTKSFITNEELLQSIIEEKLCIVAPMMTAINMFYSNFWGEMSEDYEYVRSEDYADIVRREKRGCYEAAFVHSLFLIDLKREESKLLTFNKDLLSNYDGPFEAQFVFAASAKQNGIKLHICNKVEYGLTVSPYKKIENSLQEIKINLHKNKFLHNISEEFLPLMKFPKRENFGIDKIFVLNLARKNFRREVMKERLRDTGLNATFFEAVDGEKLNETYLASVGFGPNRNYDDQKYLTMGMIGSSLSHYSMWGEAIEKNYSKIMILEDDAGLDVNFRDNLNNMLKEIEEIQLQWDLIYLGRNNFKTDEDILFNNTKHLVLMDYYNYRAFGYMISQSGARKLHAQEFISNLLPASEYFYCKYVEPSKRIKFRNVVEFDHDLKAFAIHPSIVHHSFYIQNGVEVESDTSNSHHFSKAFERFAFQSESNIHQNNEL